MHLITVHTIFDHNRVILEIEKLRGDTCNCDGTIIFEHESDFPDYESCRKNALVQKGVTTLGFGNRINITRGIADYGINVTLVTMRNSQIRFTN